MSNLIFETEDESVIPGGPWGTWTDMHEELAKIVFDYIRSGEPHATLIGWAVDSRADDDRLMNWCEDITRHVVNAARWKDQQD